MCDLLVINIFVGVDTCMYLSHSTTQEETDSPICFKINSWHIEAETNGRHFPDDIFKCICLNENVWMSIEISLEFIPKDPISNIPALIQITHWGRVTHICVSKIISLGSDNGLSPGRRQAIIWTNAWILSIGPLGTNFSEILIGIHTFALKNIHLKMSSAK